MNAYETHCCGVEEIAGIAVNSDYKLGAGGTCHAVALDPEAKIKLICELWINDSFRERCENPIQSMGKTYPGATKIKAPAICLLTIGSDYGEGKTSDGLGPYGDTLIAYIEEHKLGEVVRSKAVTNRLYHPNSKVAAALWTTDQEALQAWYDARATKSAYEQVKVAPVVSNEVQDPLKVIAYADNKDGFVYYGPVNG